MKCNDICEKYSRRSADLQVGMLKRSDELPYVLIEGTPRGLKMIAELLIAIAENEETCNFHMGPCGAGKFHFSKKATHGNYIHRVPCENDEAKIEPRALKKSKTLRK